MAIIADQQNQNNQDNNLNAGMNAGGTGASGGVGAPAGGAVTAGGQQASGQGGSNAAAPGSSAAKTPSSGAYTNFGGYTANNNGSINKLDTALTSNFNQQGQQEQGQLQSTNQIAQAVNNNTNQVNQSLSNVNNALSTGDFSNFLNPNTTPAGNTASSNQAGNPATYGLQSWAQNLATGNYGQQQQQAQANTSLANAQTNLQGMQTQQGLLSQQGGVQTLLNNILGASGKYGQGAQNLDQALVTGSNGNYNNLLSNVGQQVNAGQQNLANTQQNFNQNYSGFQNALTSAQNQLMGTGGQPGLLQGGINTLNTTLGQQAATAEQQQQAAQLGVLGEFQNKSFDAATAAQLGIGNGAALFNVLQGQGQAPGGDYNYNLTDKSQLNQFQNNPYLTLNQTQATAANTINANQLQQYSALQQMLGNTNNNNWQYNQVGNLGPAYSFNQTQGAAGTPPQYNIDTALKAAYTNAANNPTLSASSGSGLVGGTLTDTLNLNGLMGSNYINQLQQGAATGQFNAQVNPTAAVAGQTHNTADPYGLQYVNMINNNATTNPLLQNTNTAITGGGNSQWSVNNLSGNIGNVAAQASYYNPFFQNGSINQSNAAGQALTNLLGQYNAGGYGNVAAVNNNVNPLSQVVPTGVNALLNNTGV